MNLAKINHQFVVENFMSFAKDGFMFYHPLLLHRKYRLLVEYKEIILDF